MKFYWNSNYFTFTMINKGSKSTEYNHVIFNDRLQSKDSKLHNATWNIAICLLVSYIHTQWILNPWSHPLSDLLLWEEEITFLSFFLFSSFFFNKFLPQGSVLGSFLEWSLFSDALSFSTNTKFSSTNNDCI